MREIDPNEQLDEDVEEVGARPLVKPAGYKRQKKEECKESKTCSYTINLQNMYLRRVLFIVGLFIITIAFDGVRVAEQLA